MLVLVFPHLFIFIYDFMQFLYLTFSLKESSILYHLVKQIKVFDCLVDCAVKSFILI